MSPDTVLHHGNNTTLDPQPFEVSALAMHHGRIAALGDNDTVLALAESDSVPAAKEVLETGRMSDLPATKLVDEPTGDVCAFVQRSVQV